MLPADFVPSMQSVKVSEFGNTILSLLWLKLVNQFE